MKLSEIFPETVYRCNCLTEVMQSCLASEVCSLKDICLELEKIGGEKIYCVLCGENKKDVVFSCRGHISMTVLTVELHGNTVFTLEEGHCLSCIKKYLEEKYYVYDYDIFKKN